MKSKMNLKSILFIAVLGITTLFFMNISFATNTAKIKVETANLRENATSDSKILEQMSFGEEVEILKQEGDWSQVKYKKITGYVKSDLLNITNKEVTNSTEETTKNQTNETKVEEPSQQEKDNSTAETSSPVIEDLNGTYQVTLDCTLKITPLITSMELSPLKKDEKVEVDFIMNQWAHVKKDTLQGWVCLKNIQKEEQKKEETPTPQKQEIVKKTMYVNSQTVNMRKESDKSSALVTQLTVNTQVTVLSENNGWSQVEANGKTGYISSSLLSKTKQESSRGSDTVRKATTETPVTKKEVVETKETSPSTTLTSGKGTEVVAYAKTFLGCRYVYGGTSPSGFDCSGFTSYVYKHFGVSLNRTAAGQYSNGTKVTTLQIGDLVMFGKSGINHVGIYIGGNQFIHAANPSKGVRIDSLSSGYYKTNYVGARRIF